MPTHAIVPMGVRVRPWNGFAPGGLANRWPMVEQALPDDFHRLGMQDPKLTPSVFQERGKMVRMGVPPMRIEVLTEIDGVSFEDYHAARVTTEMDGQQVDPISCGGRDGVFCLQPKR